MLPIVLIGAFCFGLCLGSFANVCVWRFPRPGLTPASPERSLCPRCGFRIPWYDNIPVVSWILLGANCRGCGGPISVRYTIVELLTGCVVAYLAWELLCRPPWPLAGPFAVWTGLAWGLIVAAFIDLELMILPDEIVLPALGLAPWLFALFPGGYGPGEDPFGRSLADALARARGIGLGLGENAQGAAAAVSALIGAVVLGEYVRRSSRRTGEEAAFWGVWPFYALGAACGLLGGLAVVGPAIMLDGSWTALVSSLAGAATGAGIIALVRTVGRFAFAQEAMGFGDVKLMALLGAMAGCAGTLWTIVLASVLGSAVGLVRYALTRQRQLPFGPLLIGGAAVAIFARERLAALLAWYLGLFGGPGGPG